MKDSLVFQAARFSVASMVLGVIGGMAAPAYSITVTQLQTFTGPNTVSYNFTDLPESLGDGTLRLYSGVNQLNPGTQDGFDLSAPAEYFDLFIDGNNVGDYSCGNGFGHTPLLGNTIDGSSGGECSFDVSFSFLNDFGLDLPSLVADGSLVVDVVFSGAVNGNEADELFVELNYLENTTNIPTPATVLPSLFGISLSAIQKRKEKA